MDYTRSRRPGAGWAPAPWSYLTIRPARSEWFRTSIHFFAQESCGWCTPCWSGLAWAKQILLAMEKAMASSATWRSFSFKLNFGARETPSVRWRLEPRSRCRVRSNISATISTGTSTRSVVRGDDDGEQFTSKETVEADPKQNLLHACLSLGFDLPYFCWHPALGSVGACRQCAVKQFKDDRIRTGKLVMACMTPASEERGSRFRIPKPPRSAPALLRG